MRLWKWCCNFDSLLFGLWHLLVLELLVLILWQRGLSGQKYLRRDCGTRFFSWLLSFCAYSSSTLTNVTLHASPYFIFVLSILLLNTGRDRIFLYFKIIYHHYFQNKISLQLTVAHVQQVYKKYRTLRPLLRRIPYPVEHVYFYFTFQTLRPFHVPTTTKHLTKHKTLWKRAAL